jgi:hypothetical protein
VQPGPSSAGGMVVRNCVSWEGDHCGHIIFQIGGEEGVGGSNAEEVEDRHAGQGDKDPKEHWF